MSYTPHTPGIFTFNTECAAPSGFTLKTDDFSANSTNLAYYNNGNGLIASGYDNGYYKKDTKNWTDANGYINNGMGNTNGANQLLYRPTNGAVDGATGRAGDVPNIDSQRQKDDTLLNDIISKEYCHYKVRYQALLTAFLNAVKPQPIDEANASNYLNNLIEINHRLNALVLLVKYIADERIAYIDARNTALNATNAEIEREIASLSSTSEQLLSNETVMNTRKEMIRFTKEKNNSIANQITLWASLNVVAIAIIFHLYRKL
jgi:hypothetical protein